MNIFNNLFSFCAAPRKEHTSQKTDKRRHHQWETLARTHGRDSKYTKFVQSKGTLPEDIFEKLTTGAITGLADFRKVMGMDKKTHQAFRQNAKNKTGVAHFGDLAFWEPSAQKRKNF